MKILLTNDDGIHHEGLWALYRRMAPRHTVVVVAPDRERSAVGHAITLNVPIRVAKVMVNGGYEGYAVTGTPADCVKLGLLELLESPPDLVVAGINPGANVGININYSGTVAAAKEAALYGFSAIAVSLDSRNPGHFDEAAGFVLKLAEKVGATGLPRGTFLNVNIPNRPLKEAAGIRISQQGLAFCADYFDVRTDPRNQTYYWQGCDTQRFEGDADVDGAALEGHYISITPIKCDMTDYGTLTTLKEWDLDLE